MIFRENKVKGGAPDLQIINIVLACTFIATTTVLAETGVRGEPDEIERGQRLYGIYCLECHQAGGEGEPPIPLGIRHPDYIVAMPLNESSHAWHHDDNNLVHTILRGNQRSRLRMPVYEEVLSERDARDLVAYIKTFWSDRILECQGPRHMSCM
jgi:mono/diheme cytochrome c family protein